MNDSNYDHVQERIAWFKEKLEAVEFLKEKFPFILGKSIGSSKNGDLLCDDAIVVQLPGINGTENRSKCEEVSDTLPDGSCFTCEVYGDYESVEQVGRAWTQRIRNKQIGYQKEIWEKKLKQFELIQNK